MHNFLIEWTVYFTHKHTHIICICANICEPCSDMRDMQLKWKRANSLSSHWEWMMTNLWNISKQFVVAACSKRNEWGGNLHDDDSDLHLASKKIVLTFMYLNVEPTHYKLCFANPFIHLSSVSGCHAADHISLLSTCPSVFQLARIVIMNRKEVVDYNKNTYL